MSKVRKVLPANCFMDSSSRTEQFVVEKSAPDQRLDQFLRGRFPAASRGALKRLIDEGHI